MRIGIVCYPTYGGSGVLATELGLALARRGHHIHFITYKRPARLTSFQDNVYYHEVTDVDYPLFEYPPYDTALASKLVDVVRYEKIELLHVHYAIPHATVGFLAREILQTEGIRVPFVTTLHGTDITLVGSSPAFAPVVAFSINQSDAVTAVSHHLKKQTLALRGVNKHIHVIYNFVELERFQRTNKEHFKKAIAPEGESILVHVSNFRKVKRVEDVIHVFARVREKIPAKLLMIGDGPERHHLEELCRSLEISSDVRFLGKQDAIEELLAIADLFIMPSSNEAFGLAALEALACGVPVISSDAGGLPEVNIHNVTGFTFPIGDVVGMAEYAALLLRDKDTFNKFRSAARRQAEQFSIDLIVPQYEQLYNEVLDNISVPIADE